MESGWQNKKRVFEAMIGLDADEAVRSGVPAGKAPRSGDLCPRCRMERLDYDSLLNLACPHCGYSLGGCFT